MEKASKSNPAGGLSLRFNRQGENKPQRRIGSSQGVLRSVVSRFSKSDWCVKLSLIWDTDDSQVVTLVEPESRKHQTLWRTINPFLTPNKVEFNYKLPEFLNQTKSQKNEQPEVGYQKRKQILDRGCSVMQTIQVSYSAFR